MSQRAIARRAGVAVATVNRVLQDDPAVAPATRAKVLQVALALGYLPQRRQVPDPRRRGLLVLPRQPIDPSPDGYAAEILVGIQEAAARLVDVAIRPCGAAEDAQLADDPAIFLRGQRPLGVILLNWGDAAAVRRLATVAPLAVLGHLQHLEEPFVGITVNHLGGMLQMLDHLLALGHRRIGLASAAPAAQRGADRLGAFVQAQRLRGLPLEARDLVDVASVGWKAVLRRHRAGVSAWIGDCQAAGEGLLQLFAEAGIAVPTQASVLSFFTRRDQVSTPLLAGIRGDFRAMGRAAVQALADPQRRTEPGRRILVDACFEPGGTAAAPPRR